MSPTPRPSPIQDVGQMFRRRKFVNIPKDQRALLERDGSWAVDLKNTPHGLINVPGHVLQTVREAYAVRETTAKKVRPSTPPSKSKPASPAVASQYSHEKLPGGSPTTPVDPPLPLSSPERIYSPFSPSEYSPAGGESVDKLTVAHKVPSNVSIAPKVSAVLNHGLTSSGNTDDNDMEDLEMELPQPLGGLHVPVNRTAARLVTSSAMEQEITSTATTNTPPCAQKTYGVDLSTASSKVSPQKSEAAVQPARHQRRMKPIQFSEDSPAVSQRRSASASMKHMPGNNILPELESSSSPPSVIIPATDRYAPTQKPNLDKPTITIVDGRGPVTQTSRAATSLSIHTTVSERANRPLVQSHAMREPHSMTKDIEMTDAPVDPYKLFVNTYPDYVTGHTGDRWKFVKACFCLEFLQNERALREYLYDDFIRAFSGGYLKYVNNAGPGQEPLPALEWFNGLSGPIMFNRMAVTRNNLDDILSYYPEEVTRAKAIINQGKKEEERQPPKTPARFLRNSSTASSEPGMRDHTPPTEITVPQTVDRPAFEAAAPTASSVAPQAAPHAVSRAAPQTSLISAPTTDAPRASRRTTLQAVPQVSSHIALPAVSRTAPRTTPQIVFGAEAPQNTHQSASRAASRTTAQVVPLTEAPRDAPRTAPPHAVPQPGPQAPPQTAARRTTSRTAYEVRPLIASQVAPQPCHSPDILLTQLPALHPGSGSFAHPPTSAPISTPRSSFAPNLSLKVEQLAAANNKSKSMKARKRSAEDQARLRRHFSNLKSNGTLSKAESH